jgi:hypothetical protein
MVYGFEYRVCASIVCRFGHIASLRMLHSPPNQLQVCERDLACDLSRTERVHPHLFDQRESGRKANRRAVFSANRWKYLPGGDDCAWTCFSSLLLVDLRLRRGHSRPSGDT